jgi:GNAT superfamily N-acetyltransferase
MFFCNKPRPEKKFEIRECGRQEWQNLRKYHYLDTNISNAAQCYGLYDKDMLIGFCAVIHFPHPKNPNIKHIHRLVIHPDYQGIGLGKKLLNFVSDMYAQQKYDVRLITSAKNLIFGLKRDANWGCTNYGRFKITNKTADAGLCKSSSKDRITASFKYIGKKTK